MRATKLGVWGGLLAVLLLACGGSATDNSLFDQPDGGAGSGIAGSSTSGAAGQSSGGQNSGGNATGQSGSDSSLGGAMGGAAGIPIDSSSGDAIPGADADAARVADSAESGASDVAADASGDALVDASGDVSSETGPSDASVDGSSDAGCATAVSCYGGQSSELAAPSTACRAGTSYCINGSTGSCIGEVRPTPESCNGIDDDCNGSIDDGLGTISCGVGACKNTVAACVGGKPSTCTPLAANNEICGDGIDNNCNGIVDDGCSCVYVAPTGNDATGTGTGALPFRTISRAIAVAGSNGLANQVCVAASTTCGTAPTTAIYSESVVMRSGISVLGGYQASGVTWPRSGGCTTRIQAVDANGVQFGVSVVSPTALDGFSVRGLAAGANAAITITGSTGAIVQADTIGGGGGTTTVGVLVQDSNGTQATPLIRDSAVDGGSGSTSAIGVSVINSAPTLSSNCASFDTAGRCNSSCAPALTRYIRGRAVNAGQPGADTYAVRLQGASGTIIETSALCGTDGQGEVASLRMSGASTGVVIRQNQIFALGQNTGSMNSVGVWMDACGGAAPWIFDNTLIEGQSLTAGSRADGIRAIGDCHPRIDSNQRVVGGGESSQSDTNGVYCAKDAGTGQSSKCTVLDNVLINGSSGGFPPTATGVRCDAGACARIERNGIIAGQGVNTFGVVLNGASTFVDRNVIEAGCTRGEGIGLLSIDAPARVQNNIIWGGTGCSANLPTSTYAARVQIGTGLSELDLHSNTLLAMGGTATCTGRALQFDLVGGAPGGPRGVVRNNILDAGICSTAYGVVESVTGANPRVFENNDIWYSAVPTALYRDEGSSNLTMIAQVNGLTDMTSSGNISADPLFVSGANYHLTPPSPCRNAGTSARAPSYDFDGQARPSEAIFDIGAYEFHP